MSGYVHMNVGINGCQMRASDTLELALQVAVSLSGWVLGTEIRPPAASCTLNCQDISLSSPAGTILKFG